jgi:hypothetical protein
LWFDGGSDSVFWISNRGASSGRTSITYGNTELFTVLNSGNVGIGTTDPKVKLHVNGPIFTHDGKTGIPNTNQYGGDGSRIILWPGGSGNYPYQIGIGNQFMWYGVPGPASYVWYNGNRQSMILYFNGNLYINTPGSGIILRDTDGTGCHRITVNSAGEITAEGIACITL